MMRKVILMVGLWIILCLPSSSFAQTSAGDSEVFNPNKVLRSPPPYEWCNDRGGCGYGDPNPTLPPEMKCGACSEAKVTEVREVKPVQNQSPAPSSSEANVKGEQATPKPVIKNTVKLKPSLSPSPSPSPSASPSALIIASTPSEPYFETYEEEQSSVISNIWNWFKNIFLN